MIVSFILVVLPATMSRASWVGVISGFLAILLYYYAPPKKNIGQLKLKRFRFLFPICCSLIAISAPLLYKFKRDSADGRFLVWKVSFNAMTAEPFGVGIGRFPGTFGDAQAEYFAQGKGSIREQYVADSPQFAFNEYIRFAIEFGLLFLIFFLIFIYKTFRNGLRVSVMLGCWLLALPYWFLLCFPTLLVSYLFWLRFVF